MKPLIALVFLVMVAAPLQAEDTCEDEPTPMRKEGLGQVGQYPTRNADLETTVFNPSKSCTVLTTRILNGKHRLDLTFNGNLGQPGNVSLSLFIERSKGAFVKGQSYAVVRENDSTLLKGENATGPVEMLARIPERNTPDDRGMSYALVEGKFQIDQVTPDGRVVGFTLVGKIKEDDGDEAGKRFPFRLAVGDKIAPADGVEKPAAAEPCTIQWKGKERPESVFCRKLEDTRRCAERLQRGQRQQEAGYVDPTWSQICLLDTGRPDTTAFWVKVRKDLPPHRLKKEGRYHEDFACEVYRELAACWKGLALSRLTPQKPCGQFRKGNPMGDCLLGKTVPFPAEVFERKEKEDAGGAGRR